MSESNDIIKPKKRYYVLKHTIPSGRPPVDPEIRFWKKVKIMPNGCFLRLGGKDKDGYGIFTDSKSKFIRAHRWSYEKYQDKIPEDLILLHSCDNPSCVCPFHLRPGTHGDNMKDKVSKGRTHDQNGSKNPSATLTEDIVLKIYNDPGINMDIAKKYGVSRQNVSRIKLKQRWTTVTNPLI